MNEIVKIVPNQPIPMQPTAFSAPKNMPLGTAQFGNQSDLQVFQENTGMTYICGGDQPNIPPLGVLDDQHILVLGNTRSGKGTSVLMNSTCLANGSVLIVDPKAENANSTARRRADGSAWCTGLKQKTHLVDPLNVAGRPDDSLDDLRSRYNPLDSIDLESEGAIDQVSTIADALISVENDKDPYWELAARSLVKSVILHVLTSDEFDNNDRNLVTVYQLLNTGDRDKKEFLEEIGADQIDTAHMLLFSSMETNPAFNGQIAATGEKFRMMSHEAAKQFLGVIETVNIKLEYIESPGMQRTLAYSDFDLADLKTDPNGVSIYLCLPQHAMETHAGWLRMMITLTVNTMERVKSQPASGAPVLMMLDEFAGLRRMRVIETAISQLAGYGVKMLFGVQSLAQLKDIYKDNWETFIGNCGIKLVLSCEDQFSRDYISKLAGETEVLRVTHTKSKTKSDSLSTAKTTGSGTQSSTGNGSSSGPGLFSFSNNWNRSKSWSENVSMAETTTTGRSYTTGSSEVLHKRYLMNPDEIGRFFAPIKKKDQPGYPGMMLVLMRGCNPVAVKRCNYFEGSFFDGKYDPHPDHPYPLTLEERACFAALDATLASISFRPPLKIEAIKPLTWFAKHRLILIIGLIIAIMLPLLIIEFFLEGGLSLAGLVIFYLIFDGTLI